MIIVSGAIRIPGQNRGRVTEAAKQTMAATRLEPGCRVYVFSFDLEDPDLMRIYEEWDSMDALREHGQQAHIATWRSVMADVGVTDRKISVFEASPAGAL